MFSAANSGNVLPETIVVGDFNEDGKADLALTNGAFGTVTVLLGNGDGTFTATASPETEAIPPPLRWETSMGTAKWT